VEIIDSLFKRGPERFLIYRFKGVWRLNSHLYKFIQDLKHAGNARPESIVKQLACRPCTTGRGLSFERMQGPGRFDHFVNKGVTIDGSVVYLTDWKKASMSKPIPFFGRELLVEWFPGKRKITTGLIACEGEFSKPLSTGKTGQFIVKKDLFIAAILASNKPSLEHLTPEFRQAYDNALGSLTVDAELLLPLRKLNVGELAGVKLELKNRALMQGMTEEECFTLLWYES